MSEYPYEEGDTIVLGPEVFAAKDGSVICWKGQNYVPQEPPPQTWKEKMAADTARYQHLPNFIGNR